MNPIAEEIMSYLSADDTDETALAHYGVKRRSGRYPWGSGEDPYQHGGDFLGRVEELKKQGWKETAENIEKEFGLKVSDYRNEKAWAVYERRLYQVETAKRLRDKEGLGPTEIGRKMGLSESTVRSLLNPKSEDKMREAANTADFLRKQVDEKKMIDVGLGVERELNISRTRLDQALYKLQQEGYEVYKGGIPNVTNAGKQINQQVLCAPGTKHNEIYDFDRVKTINDYVSRDGGETYQKKFTYPESLDSSRLMVRYKEDGGIDKDGIIELRRGVADLSLGESRYAQVRIMVDGTHYLKGMAVYSDDMPKGVDVIFNTNKPKGTPALGDKSNTVLKLIKNDPDNPFGSLIKDADQGGQYWYDDPKTGKKKLGLINKRADEGDWSEWKDALPSQFLGKQSVAMAKKQLNLDKADKFAEFDKIRSLNNPTIKKHLLEKFADGCDSAAVHLQAAALPGQKYHVIIPITSLKDTEVYAPNYKNGTKLALIRYPHGGTFEIPILTVNNKHSVARKLLGTDVTDAVGINAKVAERLSGADFDGDTVMCIPTHDKNGRVKIANRDRLEQLVGFDPKVEYGGTPVKGPDGVDHYYRNGHEYKIMKDTQKQMGVISNLITDMTLDGGASSDELARAVKHSMVVIDAEKHKLDYKASEVENDILSLKKKYQAKEYDADGNVTKYGGASTLLSRSKGEYTIDKRQGSYKINVKGSKDYDPTRPEGAKLWKKADDLYYPDRKYDKDTGLTTIRTVDGKKITYNEKDKAESERYSPVKKQDPITGEVTYTNKAGDITYNTKHRTQKSTNMAETDDAYTLLSKARHPMEIVYADYANSMKSLGNEARLEIVKTGKISYDKEAKKKYQAEVDSLNAKLNDAELNKTRERAAQRKANYEVKLKTEADSSLKKGEVKKLKQQALSKYRTEVGSISRRERNIEITDKEWEAIQAGAISETKLKQILNNTDIDKLRERAMPRATTSLSAAQISVVKAMRASNYTLEQIAAKMGKSPATISKYLKGGS